MEKRFPSRREFCQTTLGAAAGLAMAASSVKTVQAAEKPNAESPAKPAGSTESTSVELTRSNRGLIYKSVKWGMISGDAGKTILEKFEIQKELGYDGIELNTPDPSITLKEINEASEKTGMPVHGAVDSKHWKIRLSSPSPKTRAKGLDILMQGMRTIQETGGNAILLVPGRAIKKKSSEENHDQCWARSRDEIRKALPLASKLGVRILIENVWNGFCETPEELRDYLDEIGSPWVGSYFDIGNVRKFGPSEDWIRILKHRIVKLDVKGWSKEKGFRAKIGDDDVNWAEVRKALKEINFYGWATAEVGGGGKTHLADVATRMNRVLDL